MASIKTRPKGSGQSIGKSRARAQEVLFFMLGDLADEIDPRVGKQWPGCFVEIALIYSVHLGCNLELETSARGDLDAAVGTLLRAYPSQNAK
jgi:hypothetical protein